MSNNDEDRGARAVFGESRRSGLHRLALIVVVVLILAALVFLWAGPFTVPR